MKKLLLLILMPFMLSAANPSVTAGRIAAPPVIDGKLDDAAWQNCIEITNFVRIKSAEPDSRPTKAYITYDSERLYIGFKCYEKVLDPVLNQLQQFQNKVQPGVEDTAIFGDNAVEIFLAPSAENPDLYYHLTVNANGALYDAIGRKAPAEWTSGAEVKSYVGDGFWSTEIAIPFKSMNASINSPWRINLCRTSQLDEVKYSSWSPASAQGFHMPTIFGTLNFTDKVPGISGVSQLNRFQANTPQSFEFTGGVAAELIARFNNGGVMSFAGPAPVPYQLSSAAKAMICEFGPTNTETFLRSNSLNLKPGGEYLFSAQVKTDYQWQGGSRFYNFFVVRTKGGGYKGIEGAALPLKTNGWQTVRGVYKNGEDTAGEFWMLKWDAHKVGGSVAFDNVSLIEKDSGREMLSNGNFQNGSAGWNVFRKEAYGPGCGADAAEVRLSYTFSDNGKQLYSSPEFLFPLAKENPAISSQMVYLGEEGLFPAENFHLNTGSVEHIRLLLKSNQAYSAGKVFVEILSPPFCRLLSPDGRVGSILPRSIQESTVTYQDKPYYKYLIEYDGSALADVNSHEALYPLIPLLWQGTGLYEPGKTGHLYFKARLSAEDAEESYHALPLTLLPPLAGRSPEKLPVVLWAYPQQQEFTNMSPLEQNLMVRKFRESGYNISYAKRNQLPLFGKYGLKPLINMAPTATQGAYHYPYIREFLTQHPEFRGVNSKGEPVLALDPAYLLEKDNLFLSYIREITAAYVEVFPYLICYDYEFPYMPEHFSKPKPATIGFSERNLALFRKFAELGDSVKLTPEIILTDHRAKWQDFRARQNAEIIRIHRDLLKEVSPQTIFALYSGYPPYNPGSYGIDWRYAAPAVDLPMVGYGGDDKLLLDTVPQPYTNAGLLIMSYADQNALQLNIAKLLLEAGSFMGYVHFVIDGRYFQASSLVAAIAADFEQFFLNIKTARRHDLTVDAATGKPRGDIYTFVHNDERLVVLLNYSSTPRQFAFNSLQLPANTVAVDHTTKQLLKDPQKITLEVPPFSLRAVYFRTATASTAIPAALSSDSGAYPVLRWQHPDAAFTGFELEYADNPDFKNAARLNNIPSTWAQLPADCSGRTVHWRVKAASGDWSKPHRFDVPPQTLLAYQRPSDYNAELGFWTVFSWGGADALSLTGRTGDTLKVQNAYNNTQSYWTNYRKPGGSTRPIPVKPGEKYRFSGTIEKSGEINAQISIVFLRKDGSFIIPAAMASGTGSVEVTATAPAEAVAIRLAFSGTGAGSASCSNFKLDKITD